MRFAKCLVKTFLSFAASGAGTAAGFGVVTIGVAAVLKRQTKPITDALKGDDKSETPTEA